MAIGLYIHLPWCIKKCPYCDFNSHVRQAQTLPVALQQQYAQALHRDLSSDIDWLGNKPEVSSLFFGGGTPSLFAPDVIQTILQQVDDTVNLSSTAEITLETNPGSLDLGQPRQAQARLAGYRAAGVNRLSIGVQSFNPQALQRLGRIHSQEEACQAYQMAQTAGFDNINLDLMFGLPGQTQAELMQDIQTAIALQPEHLSYYQLTLEENTPFYYRPPTLPDDEALWDWQQAALMQLSNAGYRRYEISAYTHDRVCQHNINYWEFGDYLGIGAGAHGKHSHNGIVRRVKPKAPNTYMNSVSSDVMQLVTVDNQLQTYPVTSAELPFEYMMNRLRLFTPFDLQDFTDKTGLPLSHIQPVLSKAQAHDLLALTRQQAQVTPKGHTYLNEWLDWFHIDKE